LYQPALFKPIDPNLLVPIAVCGDKPRRMSVGIVSKTAPPTRVPNEPANIPMIKITTKSIISIVTIYNVWQVVRAKRVFLKGRKMARHIKQLVRIVRKPPPRPKKPVKIPRMKPKRNNTKTLTIKIYRAVRIFGTFTKVQY
jgi:hypothetical protein